MIFDLDSFAVFVVLPIVGVYLLYRRPTKRMFLLFVLNYMAMNIGTYFGLHRYFSHKQFEMTSTTLESTMWFLSAYCILDTPFNWADIHRHHHRWVDDDRMDIHTPWRNGTVTLKSFITAHTPNLWMHRKYRLQTNIKDLKSKPHLMYLERTFTPLKMIVSSIAKYEPIAK